MLISLEECKKGQTVPTTIDEAYRAATAYEENYARFRTPRSMRPPSSKWAAFTTIEESTGSATESDANESKKTVKDWNELICFCCGGRGHYANECPSEPRLKKS